MPFLVMSASTPSARKIAISVREHGHGIGLVLLSPGAQDGRIVHRGASDDIDAFLAQRAGIVAKARQMFGGTHRGEGARHGEECDAFSLEKLVRADFLHTAFRDLPERCRRNLVTDLDHFFPLIRLSRGLLAHPNGSRKAEGAWRYSLRPPCPRISYRHGVFS